MTKFLKIILIIFILLLIFVIGIDIYVKEASRKYFITQKEAYNLKDIDCIIVLGASVWGDKPSYMLRDRLDMAINLYEHTKNKLLMSGDHSKKNYDEVNIMKKYAKDKGVKSSDIFMDHAGLSTYDSMYRARDIFKAKKIIIVTQKYHMYRAIYIARSLGLDAYGVSAKSKKYRGDTYRYIREILARDKDFFKCLIKPNPTYLGKPIPVSGDGNITDG